MLVIGVNIKRDATVKARADDDMDEDFSRHRTE